MNISIKSTNIELTRALKDYTEKRISSVAKFTPEKIDAFVEIGKTTNHHRQGDVFKAEVNITTSLGKKFCAISETSDLYQSIDEVRDEIVREISSSKGKKETLWKRGARKVKDIIRGFRK
jgi:putative sigma-54 modulation protein